NPATMAADKVELQFPQRFRLNFDIGKFAEPGADSVDDITALENFFDDLARLVNSVARFARQIDRFVSKRDCIQLAERNWASSNFHSASLAACAENDKSVEGRVVLKNCHSEIAQTMRNLTNVRQRMTNCEVPRARRSG